MLSKDDLELILQLIEATPINAQLSQAEPMVKRLMVLRNNVNMAINEVSKLSPSEVPND